MKILAADGGGIRGYLSAHLIQRLNRAVPDYIEKFDMFAGTSTGGLIALGLAYGITPQHLVGIYANHGKRIFKKPFFRTLGSFFGLRSAKYNYDYLKSVLDRMFSDKVLGDIKKKVLISTFDLASEKEPRTWKPKFWHNFGTDAENPDRLMPIADVALATSAAPTYFASYKGLIDGGTFCPNPSMAAVAKACKEGCRIEDIKLLSMGTGTVHEFIKGNRLNWGIFQWLPYLINIMLDGSNSYADYMCKHILPTPNYHRLAPVLPDKIDMDDADRMGDLLQIAGDIDLSPTTAWIEEHIT